MAAEARGAIEVGFAGAEGEGREDFARQDGNVSGSRGRHGSTVGVCCQTRGA
jgi:hypothetical protein